MSDVLVVWCRVLPWLEWRLMAWGDPGCSEEEVRDAAMKAVKMAKDAGVYMERASVVVLPYGERPDKVPWKYRVKKFKH